MKKMLTLILFLPLLGCSRKAESSLPFPLPRHGAQVGICAAVRPPHFQKLVDRFNAAVADQQDWMQEYLAEVEPRLEPGTPLPYHEHFRLTKSEYDEMLAGMENTTYEPVDTESVAVKADGTKVSLHFGPKLAALNDIVIDRVTLSVSTPLGVASDPTKSARTVSSLGTWRGYTWTSTTGDIDAGDGIKYSLILGTTVEGECFLYYLGHVMSNGSLQASVECLLKFDDHERRSPTR